jgi:hypothetical protein
VGTAMEARLQAKVADGAAESMYACTCGATFPGTLDGAWAAKVHADERGHELAPNILARPLVGAAPSA